MGPEMKPRSRGSRPARPAAGAGSSRDRPDPVPDLQGARTAPLPTGIPHGRADVLHLRRRGTGRQEPVQGVRRGRPRGPRALAQGPHPPGVDEGAQLRVTGEGEGGWVAPPATSTSSSTCARTPFSLARGRALLCAPAHVSPSGARRRGRRARAGRRGAAEGPAGTQNGDVLRLRGKGMPGLHGRGRGAPATASWSRCRASSPAGSGRSSRSSSASRPVRSRVRWSAPFSSRSRSSSAAESVRALVTDPASDPTYLSGSTACPRRRRRR